MPFSHPEITRGLDLLVSYANDRTQSNQESRDHRSNEIGWLRCSNVQDINGIQYQQEGVRIQSMYGSFAHLSPLPAIRVLYVSGVKGPIKVLCMQICRMKSFSGPMDPIIYLEVCTVFATGNQSHIPRFPMIGSDGTL